MKIIGNLTCVAFSGLLTRIDVSANNRRIFVNGDFSRLIGGDVPYESREIMETGVSRLDVVCRPVEDEDEGATHPDVAPVSSSSRVADVSGVHAGTNTANASVGGQLSLGQQESVRIINPLIDIHYLNRFHFILIQIRILVEGEYFL